MADNRKIWMNGKLISYKNAKIHVLTHALHYSTAIFEGIRCYNTINGPAVFRLHEHVDRFFRSAKMYSMKIPYSEDQISTAIIKTVKANLLSECYIRPIAYYGHGEMGLTPKNKVNVSIACWEWKIGETTAGNVKGAKCKISSWIKIDPRSQPMKAKAASNYANAALARIEALNDGCDEAILLNHHGKITEGSAEHIFIVKDGKIFTPPLTSGIFNGITRDSIMKIVSDENNSVIEIDLDREDLYVSDEVFMVGTAAEVKSVTEIDHIKIGNGKPGLLTKRLQNKFKKITTGVDKQFSSWLLYI